MMHKMGIYTEPFESIKVWSKTIWWQA